MVFSLGAGNSQGPMKSFQEASEKQKEREPIAKRLEFVEY